MLLIALANINDAADRNFVEELFREYEQILYRVAYGILHNRTDAEDAVQETFVRIIKHLETIRGINCNERVIFFVNIVRNISLDILRSKSRHKTDDIDDFANIGSDYSTEGTFLDKYTVEEIKNALAELSDRDYELLYLSLFKDMDQIEISKVTGIDYDNVRVYIHRARKRLIAVLKKRGIIDDI